MTLEMHGVCESRGKGNCTWSLSSLIGLFPTGLWVSNFDVTVLAVLSFRHVRLLVTPRTAARQASLFITSTWSLLKLMSTESMVPSNHLILCRPLLLLPSIFPSIRVFSKQSALHIRWPKYWSFNRAGGKKEDIWFSRKPDFRCNHSHTPSREIGSQVPLWEVMVL